MRGTTSKKAKRNMTLYLFDVYRGEAPPAHVFTLESLTRTKSLLKEDGLIIVNFNGFLDGKKENQRGRSIRPCWAGLETRILPTPGTEAVETSCSWRAEKSRISARCDRRCCNMENKWTLRRFSKTRESGCYRCGRLSRRQTDPRALEYSCRQQMA